MAQKISGIKKLALAFGIICATNMALEAENIKGVGASFPAEVYNYWLARYAKDTGNRVSYQAIGSGGGIKQIKARLVDFGASDEPLDSAELKKDNMYQFPSVVGAIAVVYNLEGIKDGELKLSNEIVSGIFSGKIKRWNDKIIQDLNPHLKMPDHNIKIIYRSDGSGTTFNFTTWLSKISKDWQQNVGSGKSVEWPVGVGVKGNDGVTQFLKLTKNSIGYVELAYKQEANLSAAQLQDFTGNYVDASEKNLSTSASKASFSKDKDFKTSLILVEASGAYPLTSATFVLLPKEGQKAKAVKEFFEYGFKKGDADAKELGFIPLSTKTKEDIMEYLKFDK